MADDRASDAEPSDDDADRLIRALVEQAGPIDSVAALNKVVQSYLPYVQNRQHADNAIRELGRMRRVVSAGATMMAKASLTATATVLPGASLNATGTMVAGIPTQVTIQHAEQVLINLMPKESSAETDLRNDVKKLQADQESQSAFKWLTNNISPEDARELSRWAALILAVWFVLKVGRLAHDVPADEFAEIAFDASFVPVIVTFAYWIMKRGR